MKKVFSKIYIEISNLCNLQCTFCPEVLREKKILDLNNFKNIIKAIEPYTERITLHLMGEPLLHPNFKEIITILDSSTLKLELTTNGILLQKHQDLLLNSKSLLQINFSLQSFMDNFPNKPIDTYVNSLLQFTKTAQVNKPDLYINYRFWNLTETNQKPEENTIRLLNQLSKSFNTELPNFVNVKTKKFWKLTDKIRIHWDTRFEWPSLSNQNLGTEGFCYGLKSQIGIHADGTVVPCCLDKEAKINLGNILHSSLPEILATERAKSIIHHFEHGQACEELCQKCSFKERFKNKVKPIQNVIEQ